MGSGASVFSLTYVESSSVLVSSAGFQPIRFINFMAFKELTAFPRYPDNNEIVIDYENVILRREISLIVFISHRWLSELHPDNKIGDKFELCSEGIEKMWKTFAPGMEECYVWCEYGCLDQNKDPAGELKRLDKIMEICDCIFTPICDKEHDRWELPRNIHIFVEAYNSEAWNGNKSSYLNRGWCRVEMFYATNIPLVEDDTERKHKMKAQFLLYRMQGRRPHLLYGNKEKLRGALPIVLPPLQNSDFEKYHPEKGNVTKSTDKDKIKSLAYRLKPYMKIMKLGYEGDYRNNKKHGKGKFVYANRDVYEGDYQNDEKHGNGKYIYASGYVYEGEWKNNTVHGRGMFMSDSGDLYEGEFDDFRYHGKGRLECSNGDTYEGEWKVGHAHGNGKKVYANGDVYEGNWECAKKHGKGKMVYADGTVYDGEWKWGKKSENSIAITKL
jgi:hypothetical protein